MDILYEDNHIIVVYKEEGILSQEDISKDKDMLTMVKEYIKVKYNKPGNVYVGLVHRLDRNTSGIMVFAKTSKAASRLSENMKKYSFSKKYLCIVEGKLKRSKTLTDYLKYDEKRKKTFITNSNNGKEAILTYNALDSINYDGRSYTLVDIELKTGRQHQIRCQLANIGHPILGDIKYGAKPYLNNYYALSSYLLEFEHPTLKENMKFSYFKSTKLFNKFYNKDDFLQFYKLI